MNLVQKLVTEDSFDANGVLIPAGHIGTFDADRLSGKEPHIFDAASIGGQTAIVEIAAVSPTGPNPRIPQQIPPDAVQGPGGDYMVPGKRLVGEVTDTADARIDDRGLRDPDTENEVSDKLDDIMGSAAAGTASSASVEGTVADVTANLGAQTDEQLDDMLAAERAGSNRKGVISAIEAEQAERTSRA